MHHLIHSPERRLQRDPTGEVNLEDLDAVETAVRAILDRHYSGNYDVPLLFSAMGDVLRAYRGEYPGLLRSDTLYHDLRHALETALTMARMLDGYAASHPPSGPAGIDADHALLGVLLALFHDIGLLRRNSEAHLWGPALTPIHEERGVEFMQGYLPNTTLGALAGESKLIMTTKLIFKIPDSWTTEERTLASMVATADLVTQLSDRYYLEKCRDFLFLEFSAFGLAGRPDSPYPDSQTLLEKTPAFVESFLYKRLDEDFQGVRRYLRAHMAGADPWEEAIQQNITYLKTLLENNDLDRLRRNPTPYTGGTPQVSQWNNPDRRRGPRGRLQLRLAMIYPQQEGRPARPMFHGKTSDIGLSGLSIVVGYNIYQEGEVVVVLALPPAYAGASRKVATATAEMTYAIYSSKLAAFKIGLAFRKFRGDGKALLEAALRHALKEEGIASMEDPS